MILTIGCWIFVIALCQGKYIEVNNEMNNTNDCCIDGTYQCKSLFEAFLCIEDDTVINITSSVVTLHNRTNLRSRNNIMIVGNGVTVACNYSGSLECFYCSNIVIKGITWDRCGNHNHLTTFYAFGFHTVVNVSVMHCTFQYSQVCTVLLSSGFTNVYGSRFLFNHVANSSKCVAAGWYGSLVITNVYDGMQEANVSIRMSVFYHNGPYPHVKQTKRFTLSNAAFLCALVSSKSVELKMENVTISTTFGLGGNFYSFYASNVNVQFTNVDFLNNSNGGSVIRMVQTDSAMYILQICSCNYLNNINGGLKVFLQNLGNIDVTLYNLTIVGNKGTFGQDYLVSSDATDQGVGIFLIIAALNSKMNLSHCSIYENIGSKKSSIVYMSGFTVFNNSALINSSGFINNVGSALYLSGYTTEFAGYILFMNNSAGRGGAIYLDQGSQIAISENSSIKFIGNNAVQYGGAIFVKLSFDSIFEGIISFNCLHNGIVISTLSSTSNVSFTDNLAEIVGNSIYLDIPESCNDIRENFIYKFNYSHNPEIIGPSIATSPRKINVCSTACNFSDDTGDNCYIPNIYMLGQLIYINATVCDYYGNVSETVQFHVECTDCDSKYMLSSNKILVHHGLFDIALLAVDADSDIMDDKNVTLRLSSVLSNEYRELTATVSLQLSSCYSGYVFNATVQQCKCNEQNDIIQCQQDYVEIKYGYWFGIVIFPKRTISLCPIHYCDFSIETSSGYYKLPKLLNDQCSSHRTGIACGDCEPGYTLAYDSPDCISTDKCSAGMTILVITLSVLYWIIVVVLVFGLMQRRISLGYAHGIIYYYSVIDILLGSNLYISDGVFQFITILSSFSKLIPQFLGKLCFVQGLSGIDQQFIHYFHAASIFLLIIVIVIAARYSFRIASFVSHCIIRVICLLILLSYTSLSSTSLKLLRPLHFIDVNGAYVYSSPSIKYFTGRHIPYGIIALLCGLFIAIGLPLLLVLEPFIKHKVNFIKIKPLLDQFQECYKDCYHWFAAYYLVCRLIIIGIVYISSFNTSLYYLQTACIIIAMTHVWIKPYKSETLNVLDGIILLTMVLVINLNSFVFSRFSITTIVVIIAIFPLFLSCLMYIKSYISSMKCTWNRKEIDNNQEVEFKSLKYVYM